MEEGGAYKSPRVGCYALLVWVVRWVERVGS